MGWFDKKVEVSVPDGSGGVRKVKVPKAQFDQWVTEGKLSKIEGVRVHISDVMRSDRTEVWEIGKDVSVELYEKFKDSNGELFVSISYKDGKPQMSLVTKEAWEMINAAAGRA